MEPGRGEADQAHQHVARHREDRRASQPPGVGRPRRQGSSPHQADNVYIVKKGEGTLTVEDKTYAIRENDVVYIPAGMKHSLSNLGAGVFEIFEIYAPSGKQFDFVLDGKK